MRVLQNGYAQSKAHAEDLVKQAIERGVPAIIFRPTSIGKKTTKTNMHTHAHIQIVHAQTQAQNNRKHHLVKQAIERGVLAIIFRPTSIGKHITQICTGTHTHRRTQEHAQSKAHAYCQTHTTYVFSIYVFLFRRRAETRCMQSIGLCVPGYFRDLRVGSSA